MKSLSTLFLALIFRTISTVQVPQKYRSGLRQKTPHWNKLGGLEEIRKRLLAPDFIISYTGFTLPVRKGQNKLSEI